MSKYEKHKTKGLHFNSLYLSKIIFVFFLIYMNWYKEIWGDLRVALYGSVLVLTFVLLFPFENESRTYLDFKCITSFYKVLLIFGIYCFFTGLFVSTDIYLLISSMSTYFSFMVVFYDCCLISYRDGGWEWLLNEYIIVALLCMVYAIIFGKPMGNGGAIVTTMSSRNNPHTLAFVFLIGIFAIVGKRQEGVISKIILKFILILFLLYGILMTGSRKTLIAVTIFITIWIISFLKNESNILSDFQKGILALVLLITIILVIWYLKKYYVGTDQFQRFMRLFSDEQDSSNQERIRMYQLAWEIWKKNPIFGVGFNQYKVYSWRGDYSHSTYAEVISCTGIIGSVILFIPIIWYLLNIINSVINLETDSNYYNYICIAGIIVEFILAVGQIWIYGFTHLLFFFSIFGVYYDNVSNKLRVAIEKNGEVKKCRYLL